MGKKSSKAPPAPDYVGAANAQAQANKDMAEYTTWANRPTQTTPWGSVSWDAKAMTDPSTGKPVTAWTQTEKLSPELQAALDSQFAVQRGLSDAAQGLIGRAQEGFSQPFDMSKVPDMPGLSTEGLQDVDLSKLTANLPALPDAGFGAVQEVQDAMMGRMRPDLDRQRAGAIQRLRSQGLSEDSAAWGRAMDTLNRSDVDASQQALLGAMGAYGDIFNRGLASRGQAFGENLTAQQMAQALRGQQFQERLNQSELGGKQRQQAISEQAYLRSLPLNELNSLLHGQQVQSPQMPGFQTMQALQGPDILGATQAGYNAQMGQYNAKQQQKSGLTSGLLGLAGSIGGSFFGPMGTALGGYLGKTLGGGVGGGSITDGAW